MLSSIMHVMNECKNLTQALYLIKYKDTLEKGHK
jgi:hypothetical protein